MIRSINTNKYDLDYRSEEINIKNVDRVNAIREDMIDTLKSSDKLFLCGKELGFKERVIALKLGKEDILVMFNPAIEKRSKIILFREKDRFSDLEYFVPRPTEVEVVFQSGDNALTHGEIKCFKLNEGASIVFSQAYDLLNGMFDSDYGLEVLPEFDTASKEEQEEVLNLYIKSLEDAYKALDDDLSQDEDTSRVWEESKLISAINRGDITFEEPKMSNRKKRRLKKFLKRFGKAVK